MNTGSENGRWYYVDENGHHVGNYRTQAEAEAARRRAVDSDISIDDDDDDDDDC